jgi:hypothetical protein
MAKAEYSKYKDAEFSPTKTGKGNNFVETSGGDVDAYGDVEKKESSAINMNAGEAFNKADYTKVDAEGTEAGKKGNKGQKQGKDDHLKQEEVMPDGNDCGKTQSYQTVKRG